MIDKGIPTTGLLVAQVLVAKYADHLPLYRQESIFARAGLAIPRSTLAQWVGTCGVRLQPLVDALKAEIRIRPANPSTPNEQLQAPSCPRKPSCTPCLKRFPIRAPVSPARAGSTARNSRLN